MPRARDKVIELRKPSADKYDGMGTKTARGGLTWRDANADLLRAAAAAVVEDGAALLLTNTSDGGALCLQVWTDSGRHKLYPATVEELTEALQLIIETASA